MPDINTMLNAAYEAYEAVAEKNKELAKVNDELSAKIVAMEERAKPTPKKKTVK